MKKNLVMLAQLINAIPKLNHLGTREQYIEYFKSGISHCLSYPLISEICWRSATLEDLKIINKWAEQEEWNPGKFEASAFFAADPKGYFVLVKNNELLACIAAVKYSVRLGFVGLYIVNPTLRGLNYGVKMVDIALAYLVDCESIGINGVIKKIKNYKRLGFTEYFYSTRWEGFKDPKLHSNIICNKKLKLKISPNISHIIVYDANIFSTERKDFLVKWVNMPHSLTIAAYENNIIKGYGVLSQTVNGYKIAPLFADDIEIAREIFVNLLLTLKPSERFYIDIPQIIDSASELILEFNLQKKFDVRRMYKGPVPPFDIFRMFGLTSLEIG